MSDIWIERPIMRPCSVDVNKDRCNCSWTSCSRHGVCCECIAYHRKSGELPACYFPDEIERSGDRSFARFIEWKRQRGSR